MPRRIITEEELREAAREVIEYELAIFDSYNNYPDHIFHGKFRLNMAALIHEVKCGAVKAAKYSMGFTFYVKQCIAAVLILFTLSCIAMPETVLAGYHKLIEVIETVFEEYTEYRYRVNDDGGIEETFKPLKLGYLPEGMEEVRRIPTNISINLTYTNVNGEYLTIHQQLITRENQIVYEIDTQEAIIDEYIVNKDVVKLISEENRINFMYVNEDYYLMGQTNLSKRELFDILNKLEF